MKFRSDIKIKTYAQCGNDLDLIIAALADEEFSEKDRDRFHHKDNQYGFLNFMMKNRHGTPFEKGYLNIFFEGPIFILRQWHRHRIAWSYSEASLRWDEATPEFYVASASVPTVQINTRKTAPEFRVPNLEEYSEYQDSTIYAYQVAWDSYQAQLKAGIGKEAARSCLPVGLYTRMYATCNPRSLMAFLSLRKHEPKAFFKSYPQWEIDYCARELDEIFEHYWPLTHKSFCENGFVAP